MNGLLATTTGAAHIPTTIASVVAATHHRSNQGNSEHGHDHTHVSGILPKACIVQCANNTARQIVYRRMIRHPPDDRRCTIGIDFQAARAYRKER
jgi:hypothetical protein